MDRHPGSLRNLILLSFLWRVISLRVHPGVKRKPELCSVHCGLDEHIGKVGGFLLWSLGGRGFSIGLIASWDDSF